jgi:hypothetical protein
MAGDEILNPGTAMMPQFGEPEPAPQEDLTSAEETFGRRSRPLSKGNLLLVAMFAAGMGCIYLLGLRGGPAKASAEQQRVETQVDTVLTQLSQANSADRKKQTSGIVNTFYFEADKRQIPANQLKTNPFVMKTAPPPEPAPLAEPEKPAPAQEDRDAVSAMESVKTMELQSVLMGAHGAVAVISNNMLTEGQTFQGWTVVKIHPKEVLLTWREQKRVLKMK